MTARTIHHHLDHAAAPGAGGWRDEHLELLAQALAGVELDDEDRRYLAWLAGWDCPTVGRAADLIGRARRA